MISLRTVFSVAMALSLLACGERKAADQAVAARSPSPCAAASNPIWVVTNTHGTATGWLTGFSSERNYMIDNYASLIDAAEKKDGAPFVFSEVPTAIAMKELEPAYLDRLKKLIASGRAALTNSFAVEYDPVTVTWPTFQKMAAMSMDWQGAEFGKRPEIAWYIDALGHDPQMAEALGQLGIRIMVTERGAETRDPVFILESAAGGEILGVSVKSYAQWRPAFVGTGPLPDAVRDQLVGDLSNEANLQPTVPFLWLIGASDYSRAPEDPARVQQLIAATEAALGRKICYGTIEDFTASLDRALKAGAQLPHVKTPGLFAYNAFRVNLPQIKQEFRALENDVAGHEAAASIVSISRPSAYPAQALSDAWWMTLLNGDRALVWGNGADSPFIGPTEWNVRDRTAIARVQLGEVDKALQASSKLVAFDPIGWGRTSAYDGLPGDLAPAGAVCEKGLADAVRCSGGLSAFGGGAIQPIAAASALPAKFTGVVDTPVYRIEFDRTSGDIASIALKSSGNVIARNANRIVWTGKTNANINPADFLEPRASRPVLGSTANLKASIAQTAGPLFTTVTAESRTPEGARIVRAVRIPRTGGRIEFDTQTSGVPMKWVVSASFGLPAKMDRQLRGVALGYERDRPRPPRDPAKVRMTYDQTLLGLNDTAAPAIRWSSHLSRTGGFALLDRGLLGREWSEDVADIMLLNAEPDYRGKKNELLSGEPELHYAYALVGASEENPAAFARGGLEYNLDPLAVAAEGFAQGLSISDSIVIEGVARQDNRVHIWGFNASEAPAMARIAIPWPHRSASLSGSVKTAPGPLTPVALGQAPVYEFALGPRDAFGLALDVEAGAPAAQRPVSWASYVPEGKKATLSFRDPSLVGHPPE